MESKPSPALHAVLIPLMAPGHLIPTADLGRTLAERGVRVSIVTTPLNASRLRPNVERAERSGLPLRLVSVPFPCRDLDLPEGHENVDALSDAPQLMSFIAGLSKLRDPVQRYLEEQQRADAEVPLCIVSDFCHMWTRHVSAELKVPRFVFYSVGCFTLFCFETMPGCFRREGVTDAKTSLPVPDIPHRMEVNKITAAGFFGDDPFLVNEAREAEATADGIVVNTAAEMEPAYVQLYEKAKGRKVWTVGPVSLCNKDMADKAGRGSVPAVSEAAVLSFLDSMSPRSVVFVSLGSLARTTPAQVSEMGLGLEKSGHPFLWVVKSREMMPEVEAWLADGFEERNRDRCLVVRGWAPQAVILSHPSVGGFVTHCGWNSTIEGVTAGVPMATWPGFSDQFMNERFVVDVLGTGVKVGVEEPTWWWDDVVVVERDAFAEVVKRLMGEGDEADERRRRALDFSEKARRAVEAADGSSHQNITDLIDEVLKLAAEKKRGTTVDGASPENA